MKIINLTPHKLNILDETKNQVLVLEPSGTEARINVARRRVGETDSVPLFVTLPGKPSGLPRPQQGTIYVVSGMFRSFCDRPDLYQPGELVRDEKGQPTGCIGLSR